MPVFSLELRNDVIPCLIDRTTHVEQHRSHKDVNGPLALSMHQQKAALHIEVLRDIGYNTHLHSNCFNMPNTETNPIPVCYML